MRGSRFHYLLAAGLALGCYQVPAEAISLDLQPAAQAVSAGDSLQVDVVISGLTSANEIVSAFDLDVTYDPSVLQATGVTFGTLLGDAASLWDILLDPTMSYDAITDFNLLSGRVDFAELSVLGDEDYLASLQGDGFSLATLSFRALAGGIADVAFVPDAIYGIDVKGRGDNILVLDVSDAIVTVAEGPAGAPAPSTLWLCLVGLGSLVRRLAR
jgi:hypothetical protein